MSQPYDNVIVEPFRNVIPANFWHNLFRDI